MSDKALQDKVLGELAGIENTEDTSDTTEQERLAAEEAARVAAEAAAAAAEEEEDEEEEDEEEENEEDEDYTGLTDEEIAAKKAEKAAAEENKSNTVVSYLQNKYGEVEGFDLGEIDPNDVEAVEKYVDAILPEAELRGAQKLLQQPELNSLYQHLAQGLSVDTWKKVNSPKVWSSLKLEDKDVATAEKIFITANKEKGLGEKQIERLLTLAKDEGTLVEESKEELKFLQKREKDADAQLLAQEQARIAQENEKAAEDWKEVETVITKGEFAGIKISAEDAKNLYKDFAYRGEDGKQPTKVETLWNSLTAEDEVAVSWFLSTLKSGGFKNGKLGIVSSTKKPEIRIKGKLTDNSKGGEANKTMTAAEFNKLTLK